MKVTKPKFWSEKNNFFSLLLIPISFLIQLLNIVKNKFIYSQSFNIPVICVGNIYLGGTGKTPSSIMITRELQKLGKKPAIIRKYYPSHSDEHELIKENVDCLFLNKKRGNAIRDAVKAKYNLAILDDGFQDDTIKKNLNILCFNSNQLIGNGMTIPSGPLRQNINSIKQAQIVLINGDSDNSFEEKILKISKQIKIFYSKYIPINIDKFKNKKLFAFAGIGNPENFFKLLSKNNLNVQKKIAFPDHYKFKKSEIQKMIDESFSNNLKLVTTEKDYLRVRNFGFKDVQVIKVKLEVQNKDSFINEVLNYI
tara:strand:+ start:3108 stop:4037 length:930 start_codon:yes stop_codon:yes gene_type:complete